MIDLEGFWKDDDGAGATPDELADWERNHAVVLPRLLREALAIRDGGALRDAPIDISPLGAIKQVGPDFWEHASVEHEVENRGLVFEFGRHTEGELGLLLDYNANGPEGEPSVASYTLGDLEVDHVADSLDEFIAAQIETDDAPVVDWDETVDAPDVLGREVVETSTWDGEQSSLEQVLIRRDVGLILYTRQRDSESEILSKTTLPGPIVAPLATIHSYRPPPDATFALHLQSEEFDGIVYLASSKVGESGWKNSVTHGAPIYVAFESADRGRLEALRSAVLGPAARVAESRESSRAAMVPRRETPDQLAESKPRATFPGLTPLSEILRQQIEETSDRSGADGEIDSGPPREE
ncbi:SMI1/KNR4 family protein [Paludisphaera borealis]|uniref:Knr4/Smi1-like domain-containing protein n=1 Tax=Paludisphaera borealis TaxID=1387353 RepID=A0A1U7CSG1_9BACT|nr:SMI1/KNR4 family protein [Paludisphaera borealis]APW61872.1 hypothetical protein BSF38_03402 [Paludisphaera borealis]